MSFGRLLEEDIDTETPRLSFGNYTIQDLNIPLLMEHDSDFPREMPATKSSKPFLKSIVDDSISISFEFHKTVHIDEFAKIHNSLKNIYEMCSLLNSQLRKWKEMYDELIQKNGKRQYLLSLDSFFFQYKIFVFELEHFRKYIAFLNHRIYGDYYRLYINMIENQENIERDISLKSHPKHKELEPFFEYMIVDIQNIHQSIISIIEYLHLHFVKTQNKIIKYKNTTAVGYSIFPFLNTLGHENHILKDQFIMYENNLHFFYEFQYGFLMDMYSKLQNFESKLNTHFKVLIGDDEYENVDSLKITSTKPRFEMDISNSFVLAGNFWFQYDNSLENNRYQFSQIQRDHSNNEIYSFGADFDSIL
jgi:hypothetical protein